MPSPCDVIETAYCEYARAWGIQGGRSGEAHFIVEELVAHGIVVDDQHGEASLEARVAAVTDEHATDNDGRMHSAVLAAEVALRLELVSADEASDYAGRELVA